MENSQGKSSSMSAFWTARKIKKPASTARRQRSFIRTGMRSANAPAWLLAAAAVLAAAPGLHAKTAVDAFTEPRISAGSRSVVGPLERPDPALSLPLAPFDMTLPLMRPRIEDRLPPTLPTLEEDFAAITGAAPSTAAERFGLQSGEGMFELLLRGGIDPESAKRAVGKIGGHLALRTLPVGFEVAILPEGPGHGAGVRLALEDNMTLALAQDGSGGWRHRLSLSPTERYLTFADGTINSSLYKAGIQAGMPDEVLDTFIQVLGFSVDFQREIRKGDRFEALYQTSRDMLTGKPRDKTELLYISMVLSGKRIEFFRHGHRDGDSGWYDGDGNGAARGLMRTPVNGARLSSGYGNRKHPILGYSRMHRGLDFAAPTGTPIMAAGSGVVEAAGRNGNYGKYVRIRHNGTYKTAYAHLSRISPGIVPGARVSQGQVIGKVGSTGMSTGPHLHYEILINNRQVNPLTVRLPSGKTMPEHERPRFERTIGSVNEELGARGIIRFASGG